MTKEKRVWRIQADISLDETDPMVTMFLGPIETDDIDGTVFVRQDTQFPVFIPLSGVSVYLKGNDHSEVVAMQDTKIAAQQAAIAAERAAREVKPVEVVEEPKPVEIAAPAIEEEVQK